MCGLARRIRGYNRKYIHSYQIIEIDIQLKLLQIEGLECIGQLFFGVNLCQMMEIVRYVILRQSLELLHTIPSGLSHARIPRWTIAGVSSSLSGIAKSGQADCTRVIRLFMRGTVTGIGRISS